MTIEDRYFAIKNDPKRRARAFKIIAIVAYSMLILGAVMILWAMYDRFF
jgi:cell division septal protein FtsQ